MVEAPRITRQLYMKVKQQGSLGKAWKVTMAYLDQYFKLQKPMNVMRPLDISSAPRNIKESKVL